MSTTESDDRHSKSSAFRFGHSRELLASILERPAVPADLTISRFFAARRYLGSHDRGAIADAVYRALRGVLRYIEVIDIPIENVDHEGAIALAAADLESPNPTDRVALARASELRVAEIDAIDAQLRSVADRIALYPAPRRLAVRHGLPVWFVEELSTAFDESELDELLDALNRQAPITLRANTLVTTRDELQTALESHGIESTPGHYAPDALNLSRRMNANAIPEFKKGWFELQDEGSQLLSTLIDPRPNWRVFDACAGAGGKTLHLAAIMRGKGEVIAHDTNERRLAESRPRIRRSGAQNIRTMSHDRYRAMRHELEGSFNAVLVDAPCTGSGVLRRNPGARLTMTRDVLDRIVVQQREILDEYAALVRPGGILVYDTCSLLRQENEEQVETFIARNAGWTLVPATVPHSMLSADGCMRTFPHRHGTDGFFGAVMRRD